MEYRKQREEISGKEVKAKITVVRMRVNEKSIEDGRVVTKGGGQTNYTERESQRLEKTEVRREEGREVGRECEGGRGSGREETVTGQEKGITFGGQGETKRI